MKTRDILSAFGLKLWRSFGMWFACRPTEGPAFAECSAKSTRELIEMIVPPPPAALSPSPGAIAAWAEECVASACGKVDPDQLAKVAFAAYGLSPSPEALNIFADSVRAWKHE
jgi:hypothetical protein